MLKFEYIDTIKYEAGKPRAMFLLADMDAMEGKRIAIFGAGTEAFITEWYLEARGIETECFVNNDPKMEGRVLCGKPIKAPRQIWGAEFLYCNCYGEPQILERGVVANQGPWGESVCRGIDGDISRVHGRGETLRAAGSYHAYN